MWWESERESFSIFFFFILYSGSSEFYENFGILDHTTPIADANKQIDKISNIYFSP